MTRLYGDKVSFHIFYSHDRNIVSGEMKLTYLSKLTALFDFCLNLPNKNAIPELVKYFKDL